MTRLGSVLALCLLAAGAAAQEGVPPLPVAPPEGRLGPAETYAEPGHVIVLTPRVAPEDAEAVGTALAARHGADLAAIWPLASLDETCYVLRLDDPAEADAVSGRVMDEDGVLLAYPIQGFAIDEQARVRDKALSPFRNEPLAPIQDALRTMGVDRAQAAATGAGVRVALIDTGVAEHPDLARQRVERRDFVGTGTTAERHGTALATMIAADGRNREGMTGVAPDVELLALRGCWEDAGGAGRCNTFSLALALDHAIQAEANVVNLSLGGPSDRLLEALVGRLRDRGALVVAATGAAPFPANVDGVLLIDDAEAPTGAARVRAPGLDVLGAEPSGGYDFFTGSSVAAANASGVAALVWSAAPEADARTVWDVLDAGDDMIDACAALARLTGGTACP